MKQSFNKAFLLHEGDVVSLADILDSEIELKDKLWFVFNRLATKQGKKQLAIRVAETVVAIYEYKYPDQRPRQVIKAAQDYLGGKITKKQLLAAYAASAAYAADAAAYAAASDDAAAYAAAYAASAVAYAADAAAYADAAADAAAYAAADAAAYAASAADAADADNDYKIQLIEVLKDFCQLD